MCVTIVSLCKVTCLAAAASKFEFIVRYLNDSSSLRTTL